MQPESDAIDFTALEADRPEQRSPSPMTEAPNSGNGNGLPSGTPLRAALGAAPRAEKGPSQATTLVELATESAEVFHTPGGDAEPYATIEVGGLRETYPAQGRSFRRWLSRQFWEAHEKAPSAQAMIDALGVIAARAVFDGAECAVAVRLAEHGGAYYLDLADSEWRAVRIDAGGWQVVTDPPVRFIRPRGVLPLPEPVTGGDVGELRGFVNVADDDDWVLLLAWLTAALRPTGPYPLLAIHGEQGSAKSTVCRVLRALVDPNSAALRAEPRDARDVMIGATNAWLLALDNVSSLPAWLSDGLCRLSTGGGFATRELYTDADEKLFDAMRPAMLNGIAELASRADLLDRCLVLSLPTIPDNKRRTEAELWAAFDHARARILGALLTAVAAGLRNLPSVKLASMPRMADFARWAVATEPALDVPAGAFFAAYSANRAAANESALESSPIGPSVLKLLDRMAGQPWTGTAGELLSALESVADDQTHRQRGWPKTARALSGALRRIGPNLRASGVQVAFDRDAGGSRRRTIRLEKTGETPSRPSQPSRNPPGAAENADTAGTVAQPRPSRPSRPTVPTVPDRPAQNGDSEPGTRIRDGRDDRDGRKHLLSAEPDPDTLAERAAIQSVEREAELAAYGQGAHDCLDAADTGRQGDGAAGAEPVPAGWTAATWAARLRYLADASEAVNPDLAAEHRRQADALEAAGGADSGVSAVGSAARRR